MNNIIKTYTFYKDTHPNLPIAKFIVKENLYVREGYIEILENELAPILVLIAYNYQNNIQGIDEVLDDRALPANRMFLADYCSEHGLNVDDIDDRLKLSHGRKANDDYYIKLDITNEVINE